MEIRLERLTLRNFRGTGHLELTPEGQDMNISGANGTGKTTIADAIHWLLFNKDSHGNAEFDLKTLKDGQPVHNLNHEVEAVFNLTYPIDVDGETETKTLTLKKAYKEKWVSPRQKTTKVLSGHTTDHFVDEVPRKKQEYDSTVKGLLNEETFRLVTDPRRFQAMKWQDRRRILLEICGDVTDEDVIASDPALAELPAILEGRKLEDHRTVIKARKAKVKEAQKEIPARIDEATRGLPDLTGLADKKPLMAHKKGIEEQEKEAKNAIIQAEVGGMVAQHKHTIATLDEKLTRMRTAQRADIDKPFDDKRAEWRRAQAELDEAKRAYEAKGTERDRFKDQIDHKEKRMDELRQEFTALSASEPDLADIKDACPTCKQALPEDQVQAAREKANADFNIARSERLGAIDAEGKALKEEVQTLKEQSAKIGAELDHLTEGILVVQKNADSLQAELTALRESAQSADLPATEEMKGLEKEKTKLNIEISRLQTDSAHVISELRAKAEAIGMDLKAVNADLLKIQTHSDGQARIKELGEQEKKLAAEYERLEYELNLTDKFVQAKVSMLEGSINSKFRIARFKLFNVLVNGGIEECCETLFNGVPYSSGASNGEQITVGLDIIRTLSEHYGFVAPIVVDNAESLTYPIEVPGQVIRLIVSDGDPVLRIEEVKEAAGVAG
jgi:hypothetical protein